MNNLSTVIIPPWQKKLFVEFTIRQIFVFSGPAQSIAGNGRHVVGRSPPIAVFRQFSLYQNAK
jgi:hypothetical protein